MNQGKNKFDQSVVSAAWQAILNTHAITILTHYRPDGDAIGSSSALSYVLTKQGKMVETIYPSAPEFSGARKPECLLINKHQQQPDLLIMCDLANKERAYYPAAFKDVPIVNIDHHISNSVNGAYDFVDGVASSTCEVLYELFNMWDASVIDTYVAECLLLGILYDTGVFHNQGTSAKTLRITAALMDKGASLFKLKTELLSSKNPAIIKLWALVLNRITISKNQKAAWTHITQNDLESMNLSLSSLIGFSDFLAEISDIDISILFYETPDGKVKVSLRSKHADVNAFAAQFGGGGHKNAAGILSDKSLQEVIKMLTSKLD